VVYQEKPGFPEVDSSPPHRAKTCQFTPPKLLTLNQDQKRKPPPDCVTGSVAFLLDASPLE
jgi:hypothetical protein